MDDKQWWVSIEPFTDPTGEIPIYLLYFNGFKIDVINGDEYHQTYNSSGSYKEQIEIFIMAASRDENLQLNGFVLGVLRSAEICLKEENEPIMAQKLINKLLDGKMRYVIIKRLAKFNKIKIDWKELDITIKRAD